MAVTVIPMAYCERVNRFRVCAEDRWGENCEKWCPPNCLNVTCDERREKEGMYECFPCTMLMI